MKLRLVGLLVVALAACTVGSALAQNYNPADLGAGCRGSGLNDLEQAVGNPGTVATLFSKRQTVFLGTLVSGDASFATGVSKALGQLPAFVSPSAVFGIN